MSIKDIEKLFGVVKVKNDICARPRLRKNVCVHAKNLSARFSCF